MIRRDTRFRDTSPLAFCDATFIGQETPKQTTEFPEIVHEPLRTLYSTYKHMRRDLRVANTSLVRIIVYSSGIVVEERTAKVVNWYPIQNLYCSAGLNVNKGKGGIIEFKQLHEKVKSSCKTLFAMVVRQPGNDGRRVLMCHAFKVDNSSYTQQLVNATQYAYRNKSGWTDPVSDKEFLNAKLSYTLKRLTEEDDVNLDALKITTQNRDKKLADIPIEPHRQSTENKQRSKSAVRSAPTTPRRVTRQSPQIHISPPSRTHSLVGNPRAVAILQPSGSTRMPAQRARAYYNGFNTDTLHNGENSVLKSASIGGFPMNRSPSKGAVSKTPHVVPPPTNNGANIFVSSNAHSMNGFQSTSVFYSSSVVRETSAPSTPRSHRVLASSEPQEQVNGSPNDRPGELTNVDVHQSNGHDSPKERKHKSSKHQRPSKKMMQKMHQSGDFIGNSFNLDYLKVCMSL